MYAIHPIHSIHPIHPFHPIHTFCQFIHIIHYLQFIHFTRFSQIENFNDYFLQSVKQTGGVKSSMSFAKQLQPAVSITIEVCDYSIYEFSLILYLVQLNSCKIGLISVRSNTIETKNFFEHYSWAL